MKHRLLLPTIGICAVCAIGGAALSGVATSSAATKAATTAAAQDAARLAGGGPGEHGPGGPGRPGGEPGGGIHSERVVPDDDGSGFVTVTSDRGTVTAIDGSTLTIKEGTRTETYATVDVVADGTVRVVRNGAPSKLAAIMVGDHVMVTKDDTTTRIFAATAAWEAKQQARHAQQEQTRGAAMTWPSA